MTPATPRVRVLGEFPRHDRVSIRSGHGRENCARLRDELWFKGREWFQDRACSMPKDDALIAELTSPTYAFTSTGKMVVESKADMKKRGMRIA